VNISSQEKRAIQEVIAHGEQFGYGNLICHLQTAWARKLMDEYDMKESTARAATARDGSGYPFKMQDDLIDRGTWDETGKRYRTKVNRTEAT